MDEADAGNETADFFLQSALRAATKPIGPLRSPGTCGNCGEVISSGMAYCDADCRDDAMHRFTAASRNIQALEE